MVKKGEVKVSITIKGLYITKVETENHWNKTVEDYEDGLPAQQIAVVPIMVDDVGIVNFIADFSGKKRRWL